MLRKRPWIISLFLLVALAAWLASGTINGTAANSTQESQQKPHQKDTSSAAITVRVRQLHPEPMERAIELYGTTQPNRSVTLRAETAGRISKILAPRGKAVKAGEVLLKIAMNDRQQELDHLNALLKQKQLEYDGTRSLNNKGFQGKIHLAETRAALKEIQARIAQLRRDMENTRIKAPFDGILLERRVEIGDYVSIGSDLATIVDLDPLVVRAHITQHDIAELQNGAAVWVTTTHNHSYQGHIRYIASVSDPDTNTFLVEAAIANPDHHLLGGLSVSLRIPLEQIEAIHISPALLALNDAGVIGIKWVKDHVVQFTPVDVVRSDSNGAWVQGLGDSIDIITVGQAFVREGETVETRPEQTNTKS